MGLSYSCSLFTSFSNAIHWIAENKLGIHGCVHVLDDFLFVAPPPKQLCPINLHFFLNMSENIGLPIKADKKVFPTTNLIYFWFRIRFGVDGDTTPVR